MAINLESYGTKIKSSSFILINEENSNGKQYLLFTCLLCKSEFSMTMKVKKDKKKTEFYSLTDDDIITIRDLIDIENQIFLFCPICGFKHNIIDVEVLFTKNKTNSIHLPEMNNTEDMFDIF